MASGHSRCHSQSQWTKRRNEFAMTTGIISLVLLVLLAIVMYFVVKTYSVLRAVECSFYPVHDIEMDAATKRTELHGGVAPRQRQTLILMTEKYENTSRVPQEHDERNKEVSELRFVKKNVRKSFVLC